MKKLTIIIDGLSGSGKTTVAKALAKKFGLKYFCAGDALKEMAIARGFRPGGAEWWESAQGKKFLAERQRDPNFDKEVDRIVLAKAKAGGYVITSRTLPYLGAPGIKIWLAVSQNVRAQRIAGRDKISVQQALKKIAIRDAVDKEIYKKLYGFALAEDLTPFDLIIDTDKLTPAQTIAQVAAFVKSKVK